MHRPLLPHRLQLLNSTQMAMLDAFTIEKHHHKQPQNLMAKAALALFHHIKNLKITTGKILILAGNGGDGYALALLLKKNGYHAHIASSHSMAQHATSALFYAKQWPDKIHALSDINFEAYDLIIDALFGIGLSKPISNELGQHFNRIRTLGTYVIAIDIPSGICANTGQVLGHVLPAHLTLTFECPKIGQVLLPGKLHCGELKICPIGIDTNAFSLLKNDATVLWNHPSLWLHTLPVVPQHAHKYSKGVLGILGGNQMTGAASLCAMGAESMGAGLVKLFCDKQVLSSYQHILPSCVMCPFENPLQLAAQLAAHKIDAMVIGPGLTDCAQYKALLFELAAKKIAIIIDASMLAVLDIKDLKQLATQTTVVLTPHEGEFKKMFPNCGNPSKLKAAQMACAQSGVVLVLKGADTVICNHNQNAIINTTGHSHLAKGGTGDVLAGAIASLIAQKVDAFSACAMATYMHGKAGQTAFFNSSVLPQRMHQLAAQYQCVSVC